MGQASMSASELAAFVQHIADEFVGGPENVIEPASGPEPAWEQPLLGFAAGDDPLWRKYKINIIGPYYWTPLEAFRQAYPNDTAEAKDLSVISWVLPQTSATKREQARQKDMSAERWARTRVMGEKRVNVGLRKRMVNALLERGVMAVAPQILPQWFRLRMPQGYQYSSCWSERHTAHAAGLGTFGLCDGLITPKGKAHRLGSVVVKHALPIVPRPYSRYDEYCPFLKSGRCGACMKRCPVGALDENGHNKELCSAFLWDKTNPHIRDNWHFEGISCGLCQVGVPCESGIPKAAQRATS